MEQHNHFPPLVLFAPGPGRPIRAIWDCRRACLEGTADQSTVEALCGALCQLFGLATRLGFDGNIWQSCLTFHLLSQENPFSLACEGRGDIGGTLSQVARKDLELLKPLFDFDFSLFEETLGIPTGRQVLNFSSSSLLTSDPTGMLVELTRNELLSARDSGEALAVLTDFYRTQGVGRLAFHRAFHLDESGNLLPVTGVKQVSLRDLVGYEPQKEQLVANTQAFLAGKPSNNVLLYGDAGTGKSTCIRSLLTDYVNSPLRLVELSTAQLEHLTSLMATLRERNYKFIVFIDDLSFEEHETGYKHLKAVIEGGLETMPDNVRVYATSNRRHLIKETWKDKSDMEHDGDIHRSDTVEEKLSLAARFGVAINFASPARKEYYNIVKTLAAKQLPHPVEEEKLLHEADRWEIRHGGISGRAAQQFIDYLAGKEE